MDAPVKHSETVVGGQTGFAVPLVVAVTGHRDLVPAELPGIRERVREFLERMRSEFPERPVTVMTSLAEGADQLVAELALELGLNIVAPLPMRREVYVRDFESPAARERFESLLARATEIFELPLSRNVQDEAQLGNPEYRAYQYAQLGIFLCAHCHILLALWDGKYTDQLGGTGQVVKFHHDDVMPGYTSEARTSSLVLSDDESDLVYHIVCSRNRPGGEPAEGLSLARAFWFTSAADERKSLEMPQRHAQVMAHTSEFSRDAIEHETEIRNGAWSLMDEEQAAKLPAGARDIDHLYRAADWLAIYYQQRVLTVLRVTHAMAFLMGLTYIAYSDMVPNRAFIFAFVVFFLVAAMVHKLGRMKDWHRKYLDYRALAEGLRVQFYWAVAGVTRGMRSKFAHDNFLQSQDSDLGWIRNVMRVAAMECNASPSSDPQGLDFAIREWIGDDKSGQLGYYRRKAREKLARNLPAERFAIGVVWISIIAFVFFMFAADDLADRMRDPIIVLMGVLLLVAGIRQSYAFSVADNELIKQYEFMRRTFGKARQRIIEARDDEERRRILRLLGNAALDEHSEWILMHRERPIDDSELWRMTG